MDRDATPASHLDPVKYEIFVHRLWAIGEEGRIALQKVSASPIVVQGGECMSSFYDAAGDMILACSGHLRFAAATSDAIKRLIEWFGVNPGFHDGDQIFFNDPYVAGAHTYDMMVIMPIFYEGRLIAWTASSSHTADTGGLLRGGATEIFHEGIRYLGVKVIERGEFREDVFKSIVEQCRDPEYVGLDLKSRIAANNVCHRGFTHMMEKFGVDFVEAAARKLLEDAEQQARARMRSLPDGIWRSRTYSTATDPRTRSVEVIRIECAMEKREDSLTFDLTGTSPQVAGDMNSTLANTRAHLSIAVTNQLFWDIPWNDGKMKPVRLVVPEGSILNCRFPAACGFGPWVAFMFVGAVSECIAKMVYAGGRHDDVNASWYGLWYAGGPGYLYGGHNREGLTTAQGLYDIHGGGLGAALGRDGVDTGGHMNIPSGGIADIERIEMQYPFVYFSRRHNMDGGGFGRQRGGVGSERLFMVYGSQDCSTDFRGYGAIPQGAYGLFGGYPAGFGGTRAVFASRGLSERLRAGGYPVGPDAVAAEGWGEVVVPEGSPERLQLPQFALVSDFVQGGGAIGDPLDRAVERVVEDVRMRVTSRGTAERIYGVVVNDDGSADVDATAERREGIRRERLARGKPPSGRTSSLTEPPGGEPRRLMRFHENLEIVLDGGKAIVRCCRCGHRFCGAEENYKLYALEAGRDLEEFARRRLPTQAPYLGVLLEYACPGCGSLLQVDVHCPALGGDRPLWDVRIDLDRLRAPA